MDSDARFVLALVVIIASTILVVTLTTARNDSQEMKSCVAAGKSWKHVKNNTYECVNETP